MRAPVKFGIFVALLAAGIAACSNGALAPVPPLQQPLAALPPAAGDALDPHFQRCANTTVQPGWVFRGACRQVSASKGGFRLILPRYRGRRFLIEYPANDGRGASVIGVDASGRRDISPSRGVGFPRRAQAFFYLKTIVRGKTITFRSAMHVRIVVRSFVQLGTQCGVARLHANRRGQLEWRDLISGVDPVGDELRLEFSSARYRAIAHGEQYYALFCSGPPPTPTPSPSPSHSPTPTPTTPPYCKSYTTPPPNDPPIDSPNNPVHIDDRSDLPGANAILYVQTGSGKALGKDGKLKTTASPIPLPLLCYPGSLPHGKGLTFEIPGGTNGRFYIAYATPVPGKPDAVPNPFYHVSGAPSLDPISTSYVKNPWDYIEYTLPNGTADVTQVDKVGLPIELTISKQPTIGVGSLGYTNVLRAFRALTAPYAYYKNLLVSTNFNGTNVLARIINPGYGIVWGMPQDWYDNNAVTGQSYSATYRLGFLGYVLAQYHNPSNVYTYDIRPANAGYSEYTACSDGTANFIFVPAGSACAASTTGAITLNASLFEPSGAGRGCASNVFQQPYGLGAVGSTFPNAQAFYLWKSMTIDFNRGTVLVTAATHPVGGLGTGPPQPPLTDFAKNVVFDQYWLILHTYYDNHQAYAMPYDEPGDFAAAYSAHAPDPWYVTVHQIPTLTSPIPSPTPAALPSPCTGSL